MNGINPPEDEYGHSPEPPAPPVPPVRPEPFEPPAPPVVPAPPAAPVPPVYNDDADPFGESPSPSDPFGETPRSDLFGTTPPPSDPFGVTPPPPRPPLGTEQPPYGGPSTGPAVPPPYGYTGPGSYADGSKPRMNWGFFALGFFAPGVVGLLVGAVVNLLAQVAAPFAALLPLLEFGLLAAAFVLWLRGRNGGDNRMRSFGLGMLWSYAAGFLLVMLLFGSCLLLGLQA